MKMIDLRSDTVTMPTQAMREAMANAVVGDDIYEDDPTNNELQALAASMLNKEAALFVPSGTMGNLLCILTHTQRADEIITGHMNHIITHEVGGIAQIAQVMCKAIVHEDDRVYPEDIRKACAVDDIHVPKSTLVCLENALSNGTVVPLDIMREDYKVAKELKMKVHLDGARIFNAAVALGCDVKEIADCADSVMFCLSKGLCSPIGSMIVGSKEFIEAAKRNRKRLGGGMRQTGVLAACGLISLKEMRNRLVVDHDNAQYLARKLSEMEAIQIDLTKVQINIVFFRVKSENFNATDFSQYLLTRGIKNNPAEGNNVIRFVTHNDIETCDLDYVIKCMHEYFD